MNAPQAMTVANDQTLVEMIQKAQRRLIYMAPGLSRQVAAVIAQCWQTLGESAVTVIVDLDPEIFRLGYGELEAVQLLKKAALEVGAMVNSQKGIRIGLLIVDDEAMVFAPTPLLIEASPQLPAAANPNSNKPLKPNAILLGLPPAGIERDVGAGPDGNLDRVVGMEQADRESMEKVELDLKRNPPLKFDVARKVLTFNSMIEFVEFELSGIMLGRRTASLPSHLLAMVDEDTRKKMHTSIQLIDPDVLPEAKQLLSLKEMITQRYLRPIPGYGRVIRRIDKEAFDAEVKKLETAVEKFQTQARERLNQQIELTRQDLIKALLPAIQKNIPPEWGFNFSLLPPSEENLREYLNTELCRYLGTADRLIHQMSVRAVFKSVTYETLTDPQFLQKVRKAMPDLKLVHEEQIVAPSTQPNPQAA